MPSIVQSRLQDALLDPRLRPNELRVLCALLSHVAASTMTCALSHKELVIATRIDHDHLKKHIRRLVDLGWVERTVHGLKNKPNEYRITGPVGGAEFAPLKEPVGGAEIGGAKIAPLTPNRGGSIRPPKAAKSDSQPLELGRGDYRGEGKPTDEINPKRDHSEPNERGDARGENEKLALVPSEPNEKSKTAAPKKGHAGPIPLKPGVDPEAWQDWDQHRRTLDHNRKPWSEIAQSKSMTQLLRISEDSGISQQEIVDYCITNGWQGFYAPKQGANGKPSAQGTKRTTGKIGRALAAFEDYANENGTSAPEALSHRQY